MNQPRRPDGIICVITGKTRSGKTVWLAQRVARCRRLLVWDAMGEWADVYKCRIITTPEELCEAVKPGARPERIAYQVPVTRKNFELFCKFAMIFIKVDIGTIIVEEISDVSSAGKATQAWGELLRKGLRFGPEIYAITQRPQESDKTMVGMATFCHCHQIFSFSDQKYVAERLLQVPVEQFAALKHLEFLERYQDENRTLIKGKVKPPRAPRSARAASESPAESA